MFGGFGRKSTMSESMYRVGKLLVLSVLVAGVLGLGCRATEIYREASRAHTEAARRAAKTGRYQHFDFDKIRGGLSAGTYVVDTRDGSIVEAKVAGNAP
jgi:hypothetical protein